jgi:hypothetical protein
MLHREGEAQRGQRICIAPPNAGGGRAQTMLSGVSPPRNAEDHVAVALAWLAQRAPSSSCRHDPRPERPEPYSANDPNRYQLGRF